MDIFETKMPDVPEQVPVKVSQSLAEQAKNFVSGMAGDMGARSVEHVERPRYGHKV